MKRRAPGWLAANELEPSFLEILAHLIGDRRSRGDILHFSKPISNRLSVCKLPDVFVEGAEFLTDFQEELRVDDGRFDLQSVPNDSGILEKLSDLSTVEFCNPVRMEAGEGLSEILPFS